MSTSADEIRDLMFEYCWLLDRGEIDAVGELMQHATVHGEGVVIRFSALAALIGFGSILYFACAQVTGAVRLHQAAGAFRRK